MRQVTIKIPEITDILPRADLLKGWRTTILNGGAVLFGTAATAAPEMLLPSPAWLTHGQAAGLFVVILGAANMVLRTITTTPLGMRQERERVVIKRVTVPAPPVPADYWAAREEMERQYPLMEAPQGLILPLAGAPGRPLTADEIAALGDADAMPDITAPWRDREPDKPTFTPGNAAALSMVIGFGVSFPLWCGALNAGWLL